MPDYRLDELARISGVSARNIRAYRERGLLDPPRREGRSAYYDDYHLAQLQTINQLLGRGYTSAHIAEFFENARSGHNLAEFLGVQPAILRPPAESPAPPPNVPGHRLDIDPDCAEAVALVDLGVATRVDGALVLVNAGIDGIVARAPDQLRYVRTILQLAEATRDTIDELADEVISALVESVTAQYSPNTPRAADDVDGLNRIVADYRDLGDAVVADLLDRAFRQRVVTAVSEFNAGLMTNGQWHRPAPE